MKPIDVKNNKRVYIAEHNGKDSKFKVGDRVRISRYKNIFAKGYTPNWSKEIFFISKKYKLLLIKQMIQYHIRIISKI